MHQDMLQYGRTRQHLKRSLKFTLNLLSQHIRDEEVMRMTLVWQQVLSMWANRSIEVILDLMRSAWSDCINIIE